MQITILGSGTLVPTGVRGPAGYAVETDGTTFLLDGGSGTLRRLAEAGIDYRAIDHLFYSHVHPDHTGDLIPFLFAQRHIPPPAAPRARDLTVHGPRGFAAFYRQLALIYGRWVEGEGYASPRRGALGERGVDRRDADRSPSHAPLGGLRRLSHHRRATDRSPPTPETPMSPPR